MAVKYKVIAIGNPQNQAAPKKFYARVVKSGDTSLHSLSKEIAGRSSLTVGDVKNVIEQFIDLIPQHLSDGNTVRLGYLGTFALSCSSEGKETSDEVNSSAIKSVKASYRPGTGMKNALKDLRFVKESQN